MRKFHLMLCAFVLCEVLSACQSPRLQPTDTSPDTLGAPLPLVPAAGTDRAAPACAPRVSQPWILWPTTQEPLAVRALLTDQETLWAGTSFGVFRVDPRTDAFTPSLDYQVAGPISKLFPLSEGRLWAEGERGQFYYDGQAWMPLQITGAPSSASIWTVDLHGDTWLVRPASSGARYPTYYHLLGHVPPSGDYLWKATQESPANAGVDPYVCRAQSYVSYGFSYRTPAECEALNRTCRGLPAVMDADGSIWWLSDYDLPVSFVYTSAPDPKHGIWFGTDKGLVYWDGTNLRRITFGLDECTIPLEQIGPSGFAVDSRGKAWMSTRIGILTLSPGEWTWQPLPDLGLSFPDAARPIQAIVEAPGGGMWATHGYDLFRIGGATTFEPIQPPDPRCFMQFLAADSEFVWSSRIPQGDASKCDLLQFVVPARAWAYHPIPNGYLGQVVVGSDGTVYALGPEGLYRRVVVGPRSEFRPVGAKGANLIVADKQGGIWVASREKGSLWHYKSGRLMPLGRQFQERSLRQITVDRQNRLWVALSDVLLFFNGKTWRRIATPLRQIRELTGGPDGRIWIVGDIGIAVYDPAADKQP
jgi:ligand-binding sensor domain-containing protein